MRRDKWFAARVLLVIAGLLFAAVAVADLATNVASGPRLHTAGDYLFESLLIPYAAVTLAAVYQLRKAGVDGDSRAGRIGVHLAAMGLLGFLAPGIVTLVSGNADALGPVYFLAELLSVVGIALVGYAVLRSGRAPRWVGPVLAIGWLLGSPVMQNVPGVSLVGAAAFVVVAAGLAPRDRRTDLALT